MVYLHPPICSLYSVVYRSQFLTPSSECMPSAPEAQLCCVSFARVLWWHLHLTQRSQVLALVVLVLILKVQEVKRTFRLPLLALPSCPLAVDAPHLGWREPQGTSLITHNGIVEQLPKDAFQLSSHFSLLMEALTD